MGTIELAIRIQGTPLVFGLPLAVIGGLLSFVSPCVLPLVPGYVGYLAGTAVDEGAIGRRRSLVANGLAFVLGFSAVFTFFGIAVGQFLTSVQAAQGYVRWIGGIAVVVLGFHMLGLIHIPLLDRTFRARVPVGGGAADALQRGEWRALARSFIVGIFFAAGWSPCVGPILGGIYSIAGAQPAHGGLLLFAYSLGLGVPFLLVAVLFGRVAALLHRVNRYYGAISLASGLFLIAIGVLLLTDTFARLARYAPAFSVPGLG